MANICEKLGEMNPDNLIASIHVKQITGSGVIPSGSGVLKRGTVLAVKSGALSVMGGVDGATPYGILCDDVDATESEQVAEIYLTGCFNKGALIVADSYTLTADDIQALRTGGIFVENVVGESETV